jgi:hypothetical protein
METGTKALRGDIVFLNGTTRTVYYSVVLYDNKTNMWEFHLDGGAQLHINGAVTESVELFTGERLPIR